MTVFTSKRALRTASRLTLALLALCPAGAALAQQTSPAAADADAGGSAEPTIIVTGSRIAKSEVDNPNPVTVVSAQAIEQSGTTNLTAYLSKIPALSGSFGAFDGAGDNAFIGGTGINMLDLRNLGYDRTLTLIDGRRHVASLEGTQAVDINTIPQDLVERVEVLTGGASAIYGADGVSGVVNFIMKKDFEGLTGHVQNGISTHGDAGQRLISLTAGHNFAQGRGNISLSWEHSEEDRLDSRRRSRYSGKDAVGFFMNSADTETGTQNNDGIPDRIPLSNVRYYDTTPDGGIDVDFDGMPDFYGAEGLPYAHGTYVPSFFQQGGSGTLVSQYNNDIIPQVNRDLFNAMAHFEVSPALTLYAEGKYANSHSYSLGQPTYDYYLFIDQANPFIPSAVQPYVNPDLGGVLVNRDNFDLGQRGEAIKRETMRSVLGAKGELATNLNYDVSWVWGRTNVVNHHIGNQYNDRFFAAIDVVSDGHGGVTCRANLDAGWTPYQPYAPYGDPRSIDAPTTFTPGDGTCKPLNLFGQNLASNQAAIDWITQDTIDRSRLTQNVVSGAITGNSGAYFSLPGGPVGFAVGGEYRKETSSFTPDPVSAAGLTYINALGKTKGQYDVKEAFAEIDLPVLADMAFAHRLDVNGAARWSRYSTTGTNWTWKLGADYAPVRDITFRGTYSRAVRAPNIGELFSQPSQTYEFINDPCDENYLQNGTQYRQANCQALLTSLGVSDPSTYTDTRSFNLPGYIGGNPDVRQEVAKTWTAGLVLQPEFLRNLVITADWYDIKIENAISTVTPQKVADLCVDQPSLSNPYCAQITRTSGGAQAGFISSFNVGPVNVANFRTSGLDVTLDYKVATASAGTFGLRLIGSYLNRLTYIPIPGADAVDDKGQPGSPRLQGTADVSWQGKAVRLNWRVNYASATWRYDKQTIDSNPDIVAPQYLKYDRLFSHDLYASVDIDERFEIYGGINNVFNQQPSLGSLNQPISAVGRYLYMGARIKLADLFGGAK